MAKKTIQNKGDSSPKLSTVELDDALTKDLLGAVNSSLKDNNYKAAYYLSDPDINSDVKYWVGSGSSILNLAISNRPNGGFPVGRISEITGMEQSGKSLLAAHTLVSTQKMGGVAVLIDTEAAMSKEFLSAIGVNLDKLLYIQLETMEDIFTTIETIIAQVRLKQKDKIVTIVVDSVMGASTKQELDANYDKAGYATSKSIIISQGMRKLTNLISRQNICLIFTNQLRVKMGVSFGDTLTTSGGKALAFHASVRLRLKSLGQIKATVSGVESVVGSKTQALVQKNRMGPPLRKVEYDIYFDSGIDDYGSWLSLMKTYKIVKEESKSYIYKYENPLGGVEELKFKSKEFKKLIDSDENLKAQIYDKICEAYIMHYKVNSDFGIDDVTIDTDFLNEDA